MFKKNEGILDRLARVTLGLVLLPTGLFALGGLQGSVIGLVVVGYSVLPLTTGLTGFCPLYVPFGFSTLEKENSFITRWKSMAANCMRTMSGNGGRMCLPSQSPTAEAPKIQV